MQEPIYMEDQAMHNAYDLLMENTTVEKILDRGDDYIYFPFDPTSPAKEDVTKVLKYFESEDEYDKCIEIQKYLKTM